MKKILCFLFILIFINPCLYARKRPDPLYLNSDVIDMDIEAAKAIEKEQKKQEKKEARKKKRKKNTSNKIKTYEEIDKSKTPITLEDYDELSKEILRTDFDIPEPKIEQDKDFIFPEPQYRVIGYNSPPGQRNIDLTQIMQQRVVKSAAILSPDKTKMVYTKSFYYPQKRQTASGAYYIPIKNGFSDAYDILYKTNIVEGMTSPLFMIGDDFLQDLQFKTLFPLDFSNDSKKIAFKEKVGSNLSGTWVTNVLIYDFETQSIKRLNKLREVIIDYWRQNKNIELKDYMWDIYPLGWDSDNKNRIVVYAYAYTKNRPLFLGTWSIDSEDKRSELVSIDKEEAKIELNGYGLIEVKMQH